MAKQNAQFVEWFRQSSPYIHAHRGKVLVVSFDGEAITDSDFAYLMYDVALLNGLGMKLVLVLRYVAPRFSYITVCASQMSKHCSALKMLPVMCGSRSKHCFRWD